MHWPLVEDMSTCAEHLILKKIIKDKKVFFCKISMHVNGVKMKLSFFYRKIEQVTLFSKCYNNIYIFKDLVTPAPLNEPIMFCAG